MARSGGVNPIAGRAAIVGVGFSQVSRAPVGKTLGELTLDAVRTAVHDAGISLSDIDGLANYPNPSRFGSGFVDGLDIASARFLAQFFPVDQLRWHNSITGGTAVASTVAAVQAVATGSCNYALVWRSMYRPEGTFGVIDDLTASGDFEFRAPYGMVHNVSHFALPFSQYMARAGVGRTEMADFIVRNRAKALLDPDSVFAGRPLDVDAYLAAPMVSDPLCMYDCDMPVTGCGAIVVTSAERAADLRHPPARVIGHASLGISPLGSPAMTLDGFISGADRVAAVLAESSGLSPADYDNLNLYDGFSYMPLLWLEAFGFCGRGEALSYIADGHTDIGGRTPLNTSGGALGRGRLHGMPQLIEGVLQIRGEAGERQVRADQVLIHAGSPFHGCAALAVTR